MYSDVSKIRVLRLKRLNSVRERDTFEWQTKDHCTALTKACCIMQACHDITEETACLLQGHEQSPGGILKYVETVARGKVRGEVWEGVSRSG